MSLDTGLTRDTRTSFPYRKQPPKVLIAQAFQAEEWGRSGTGSFIHSTNVYLRPALSWTALGNGGKLD